MGMWFTTRMTVVKLSDGSLWVDSPVPVSFDTLKHLSEIGPVKYLIAATPRHVWRLDGWHTLFPDAQLWTSRPTRMTLNGGKMPVTGILGDVPNGGWAEDLDQLVFKGNPLMDEVIFFHKRSRTVILDDLIQSHPMEKGKRVRNAIYRIDGVASPEGGVGLDIRLTFTNRKLAKKSLAKLLSWDFDRLIIAHGPCVKEGAKASVERAFQWLHS